MTGKDVGKWISVDGELPKRNEEVLVVDRDGDIGMGYFVDSKNKRKWKCFTMLLIDWDGEWGDDASVTHWMPLPDPPPENQS